MAKRSITPASSYRQGHQYTVSADLGGGEGVDCPWSGLCHTKRQWHGNKVQLAAVSRLDKRTMVTPCSTRWATRFSVKAESGGILCMQVDICGGDPYGRTKVVDTAAITTTSSSLQRPQSGRSAAMPGTRTRLETSPMTVMWTDRTWRCLPVSGWPSTVPRPAWCEGADLDHAVNNVNLQDLAVLAANWMNCTNPSPPCCCNP